MAIPALLGLPALGTLLTTVFAGSISQQLFYKTARLGFMLVFAAALWAALSALDAYVASEINGLLSGFPPEVASIGMLLPSNVGDCIQACIAVHGGCIAYTMAHKVINFKVKAVQ